MRVGCESVPVLVFVVEEVLLMKCEVTTDLVNQQISVRMPMDSIYKKFMDALEPDSNDKENRFYAGVQCVIWGSLFIEALVNRDLELLFNSSRQSPNTPEAKKQHLMWKLAERSELSGKVDALSQLFEKDKAVADLHSKQLQRLIRLRNRLVHFKDPIKPGDGSVLNKPIHKIMGHETEQPAGTFTLGQVNEKVNEGLPNPDIIDAVLDQSLDQRRDEINNLAEWIISLKYS